MYGSAFKALLVSLFLTQYMYAEVVRVEIQTRSELTGGKSFGLAGPYEKLAGKIYFVVDPKNAANRSIADIDLVPRNPSGKVEFPDPQTETRRTRNGAALLHFTRAGRPCHESSVSACLDEGFV